MADREYCATIVGRHISTFSKLRPFTAYLKRNYGGIFKFGRHALEYFSEVVRDDPGYCAWAVDLEDPQGQLRDFVLYVHASQALLRDGSDDSENSTCSSTLSRLLAVEEEGKSQPEGERSGNEHLSSNTKRQKCDAASTADGAQGPQTSSSSGVCKICFGRQIRTAFIECGHKVACLECAARFENKPCPICRERVAKVLRTFDA